MADDEADAVALAEALGLGALAALDPALVARAWRAAQGYATRRGLPEDPRDEPAHVFVAGPTEPGS